MDAATKDASQAAARGEIVKDCLDLEPRIRGLRHMATIAMTLFEAATEGPHGSNLTFQMPRNEFECLQFAVSETWLMARQLDTDFLQIFEKKKECA